MKGAFAGWLGSSASRGLHGAWRLGVGHNRLSRRCQKPWGAVGDSKDKVHIHSLKVDGLTPL